MKPKLQKFAWKIKNPPYKLADGFREGIDLYLSEYLQHNLRQNICLPISFYSIRASITENLTVHAKEYFGECE